MLSRCMLGRIVYLPQKPHLREIRRKGIEVSTRQMMERVHYSSKILWVDILQGFTEEDKKFYQQYPTIKTIDLGMEGVGPSRARNELLNLFKTNGREWLLLIDDDNYLDIDLRDLIDRCKNRGLDFLRPMESPIYGSLYEKTDDFDFLDLEFTDMNGTFLLNKRCFTVNSELKFNENMPNLELGSETLDFIFQLAESGLRGWTCNVDVISSIEDISAGTTQIPFDNLENVKAMVFNTLKIYNKENIISNNFFKLKYPKTIVDDKRFY